MAAIPSHTHTHIAMGVKGRGESSSTASHIDAGHGGRVFCPMEKIYSLDLEK